MIVELAAQSTSPAEVASDATIEPAVVVPTGGDVVVTMNKIERYKKERTASTFCPTCPDLPRAGGSPSKKATVSD